jgi:hypothetical protein
LDSDVPGESEGWNTDSKGHGVSEMTPGISVGSETASSSNLGGEDGTGLGAMFSALNSNGADDVET